MPSLRQFQYWYGKNRDIVTEQKKRNGENMGVSSCSGGVAR
jgi:hypothetical protein